MEMILRICFPLLHKWKLPKVGIMGIARSFGDALELNRKALSVTYLTALGLDRQNECPVDDDLEGRDPRW